MSNRSDDIDTLVIQSYLDNELDGADLEEFERKLSESPELAERVAAAETEHEQLRELLAAPPAPAALHAQIRQNLDREDRAQRRGLVRAAWSWALPSASVAAAAAALLFFIFQTNSRNNAVGEQEASAAHEAVRQRIRTQTGVTPVVDRQSRGEVSASLARYFSTPVRPPRFPTPNVRLEGWRPAQLQGFEAAQLLYVATTGSGRHRLSVHIIDAHNFKPQGARRVSVGNQALWVDRPFGFSAVSFKDPEGIGYIFTSEMSEAELTALVASSDLFLAKTSTTAAPRGAHTSPHP